MARFLLIVAALLGLAWVLTSQVPERLAGAQARIVDGDTFWLGGTKIRVFGIDAPEAATPLGPAATDWLRRKLDGQEVDCVKKDTDRYGRTVATCYVGGSDIARQMVFEGWARAYRRFSTDYVGEEEAARQAHRGIWQQPLLAVGGGPGDCQIKGNISSNGQIYHVPGTRDYDMTRIDTSKGERWFCSEDEARAAGWRAAGR